MKPTLSVDYSLNSTGLCLYYRSTLHYASLLNLTPLNKCEKTLLEQLKSVVSVFPYERHAVLSAQHQGLSQWEREHISNVLRLNAKFTSDIASFLSTFNLKLSDVSVILENYSHTTQTNTIIQLVENTFCLKRNLFDAGLSIDDFYIVPAPVVKKFAGSGAYDKFQMLSAFLQLSDINDAFQSFCLEHHTDLYVEKTKRNEVLTPISDLVDAFWLNKFFQDSVQ